MGELLAAEGAGQAALRQFEKALLHLKKKPLNTFSYKRQVASLLFRTGRADEAFQAYEVLLKEHPRTVDLRVEYGAFLLSHGHLAKAKTVLTLNPAENGG